MRRLLAPAALLLGLLTVGCSCPWEGRNVWLADAASEGKTLQTTKGDELLLDLEVTPGSKARWYVVEVDEKVLERKGPAEEQAGGTKVRIPFHARRPGVTDLVAFYAASRSSAPERTFRTTIWVR